MDKSENQFTFLQICTSNPFKFTLPDSFNINHIRILRFAWIDFHEHINGSPILVRVSDEPLTYNTNNNLTDLLFTCSPKKYVYDDKSIFQYYLKDYDCFIENIENASQIEFIFTDYEGTKIEISNFNPIYLKFYIKTF